MSISKKSSFYWLIGPEKLGRSSLEIGGNTAEFLIILQIGFK